MNFKFSNPGKIPDDLIQQVSVSLQIRNQWVFVKDEKNEKYDLISDIRKLGETLSEAGCRILKERFELENLSVQSICPFSYDDADKTRFGMLLFAKADDICAISDEAFEFFTKLPDDLARGEITRRLFMGTQGWLNMQSGADELWDVYDENRKLTGRLHRRGDFLDDGDYHLVVHIWLLNSKGEFLLTKRAPNKGFPNTWETSGGAAQAGDDSITAALREVREETGLVAFAENAKLIYSFKREDDFCDVWLIRQDFELSRVVLLDGETIDKKYVCVDELRDMYRKKELIPYSYLEDFLNDLKFYSGRN